jgi:excisionase family DNA binding protein
MPWKRSISLVRRRRAAKPDPGRTEPLAEPELFSIPQFCRKYNTSRSSVYGFLRDNTLKAVKVGRSTRIRPADAEAWAAALATYKHATPKPKLEPKMKPRPESKPSPLQDPPDQPAMPQHPAAKFGFPPVGSQKPKRKPKPQRQKQQRIQGRVGQDAAE